MTDPGTDPAAASGYEDPPARKGFFTDTSVCIGCKACEVACKEWNEIPGDGFDPSTGSGRGLLGMSYDNTGALGGNAWRHVAFVEQSRLLPVVDPGPPRGEPQQPSVEVPPADNDGSSVRWLMSSDVCKHCTHAACLDVCPTGSLFRTEFGTVVVQPDICNGCGYCVPACPYGVIERRTGSTGTKDVGIAQKCTLCYDRLAADQRPACAQACPTESIQFGDVDELRARASERVQRLHDDGVMDARLYGADPDDGVGGAGAFFLLLDEPEVYGLPPDPVVTTRDLPAMYQRAAAAGLTLLAGAIVSFLGRRR